MTVQIFFNLQKHPTFHSEERLVNFVRGRESFVSLSILHISLCCQFRLEPTWLTWGSASSLTLQKGQPFYVLMSFEVIVFVYTNWQDVGIQTHDDIIQSSANHLAPPPNSFQGYILFLIFKFYGWPYMCIIFPLGVLYPEHWQLAFWTLSSLLTA